MSGIKVAIVGLIACAALGSTAMAQTSLDKAFKSLKDIGGKTTTDASGSQVVQGL